MAAAAAATASVAVSVPKSAVKPAPKACTFSVKRHADLTPAELKELIELKHDIFVVTRGVEARFFYDDRDAECEHAMLRLADEPKSIIGTARIFWRDVPVKIGRVGIAVAYQNGGGYGSLLMTHIQNHLGSVFMELHAQKYVETFYARLGWKAVGDDYMEANILHVTMQRNAPATATTAAAHANSAPAATAAAVTTPPAATATNSSAAADAKSK